MSVWACWIWIALARADALEEGHAALEAGDPDKAIAAWSTALGPSATGNVYYDLGCAWYRKGDAPRALAYWRRARALTPWDGDAAHNVALARTELTAEGKPELPDPVGEPRAWMTVITPGLLAAAAAAVAMSGSGALLAWWRGKAPLWVGLGAWLFGLMGGAMALDGHLVARDVRVAVVVDAPLPVRDLPAVDAAERFVLAPGAELWGEIDRDGFLRIRTSDGRAGWVPRDGVWIATEDPRVVAAPPVPQAP